MTDVAPLRFPPSGQRLLLPLPPGSADALLIADLLRSPAKNKEAAAQPARQRILLLTASAADAQRLANEIPWFAPDLRVGLFPDWETLPYDPISPHPDLVSERLATLWRALQGDLDCLIAPVATAMQRLAPTAFLSSQAFLYKPKDRLDADALRTRLIAAGYCAVSQVYTPGEFTLRGGVFDLFPTGSALPYRIELFDAEIESIRTFDPDTQRTLYKVGEMRLLPAREFPLDEAGITTFRANFRDRFEGDPARSRMYKDVSNKLAPAGIEYALPLFFNTTASLFDYLPAGVGAILHGDAHRAAATFWHEAGQRYQVLSGDRERPLLPPTEVFLAVEQLFAALQPLARIELTATLSAAPDLPWQPTPAVQAERRDALPYARLAAHLQGYPGPTVLVAESLGRRESLANALAEHGIATVVQEGHGLDVQSLTGRASAAAPASLILTTGPLASGFVDSRSGLCLLTETELYARAPQQRRGRDARKNPIEGLIRDLSELKIGDPVVHTEHGIGRYLGLTTLNLGEGDEELLHLEYAKGDKLFVPVAHLHLIARYLGADPEHAPLHALGSPQWDKAKRRAQEKARDTAAELLNLYALRAAREGHRFDWRETEMEAFAEGFGFAETPDQAAAIEAVLADMRAAQPMDRLVCGDVGFGKTEVALRAAFAAVAANKQVIVLCPTTLLAEQHFQTFSDRFSDLPVRIAELSRFRSSKEINAALAGLAKGSVDIVIGTHKLLQPEVRLARLGLVIIDEEHRFGVRQKEALRSLRAEVDCLALTATPIPRTLAMSLEGIRDFSVIATAPSKRLAIKTFVQPESDGLIREAVLRELKRGGQIYFLHNEVETIQAMRVRLEKLLPEARIEVAHGQMPERDLEHVMRDFYHQRFNLLLCTTIIETGINVPTANTILMHRADKFGLAQLHQLRGRVGRSHHQAYAYLLTPPGEASITRQAHKRLEAICQMEELGSGFHLAMQDLEIRGAGEVLGESQSGEMQEVGFNLYNDMLTQAVEALKSGQQPDMDAPLAVTAEINLHLPARLPDVYCNDVHERLVLYKRLASCDDEASLNALQEEMIDRFGLLPEPSEVLLAAHRLRIRIQPLGIRRLDASESGLVVQFVPKPPIDPMRIITLIQTRRDCKLAGPDRIRISLSCPGLPERLAAIESLIKALS